MHSEGSACYSLVPSPLPAAILLRARKMVWETEPTFLVRDVAFSESRIPIRLPIGHMTPSAAKQRC